MYRDACAAADIAPGGLRQVTLAGRKIVIGNVGGRWYAVACACGHLGASLETGTLDGTILTCPLHFAQFDITTGEALSGPLPPDTQHPTHDLACYPLRLENGRIMVDV